jgi:hypothetical protein
MEWIFETYVSKFLHVAGKTLPLRVSFEVDVKTESITTNRYRHAPAVGGSHLENDGIFAFRIVCKTKRAAKARRRLLL